jgi:hypothetical protein
MLDIQTPIRLPIRTDLRFKVVIELGRSWAEAGKYNVMPLDGSALER